MLSFQQALTRPPLAARDDRRKASHTNRGPCQVRTCQRQRDGAVREAWMTSATSTGS
jgi:hypothetical protein